jgi:SAM-dependent methyltransferase
VSYAALTREDSNPIKRWLQERRLSAAIALVPAGARRIVDYGAGDGEVAARLARLRPDAEVVVFEPTPQLHAQAQARLAGLPRVRLVAAESGLDAGWAEVVLCLEVFEHLPEAETEAALDTVARALAPGGRLVCGVPVEVGPPALAKGLFRRARRPGSFDARLRGIAGATLGRAPAARPVEAIAPGRAYHPHHLGFDHRRLLARLRRRFRIERRRGSPFGGPLSAVNAELYIVAVKE